MNPAPQFSEMPYSRPNGAHLQQAAADLLKAWDEAPSSQAQIAVIEQWDAHQVTFQSNQTLAMVHFQQDTTSAAAKEEKVFFDDLTPAVLEANLAFLKRVTASPWRSELEEKLGSHAFALWDCFLGTFEPAISDLKRRESSLSTEYSELMAQVSVNFQGEQHNLSTLRGFFGHADRQVRLEAQQLRSRALGEISADLDRIYDELVGVRHEMASVLGYPDFVPLGYRRMDRTDYTADDVSTFRAQVRERIVPLTQKIYARRARALGLSEIRFHDEAVRDLQGVPRPLGGHDWMVRQAHDLFANLGSDFGSFFEMMTDCELLDLKARPGKAGGGFCADVPRYGVPFIFANFNGTQDDVNVFTHECGHAFQCWSSRAQPLLIYRWPTYEAAEIHSMSLEFLSYPHMEVFFGDDADRYRTGHLEDALLFLPYGCAVDEFQHRVYEAPEMTPHDRAEVWRSIEAIYLPHRRYDDMPHHESGRLWQQQSHIFQAPFYYIDYCLAQTCALQMWHSATIDREATMARYRRLCSLGGSLPFTGLLEQSGLSNPFKPGCLDRVCDAATQTLGLT